MGTFENRGGHHTFSKPEDRKHRDLVTCFPSLQHRTERGLTAPNTVGLVVEYAPATGETRVQFLNGVVDTTDDTSHFFIFVSTDHIFSFCFHCLSFYDQTITFALPFSAASLFPLHFLVLCAIMKETHSTRSSFVLDVMKGMHAKSNGHSKQACKSCLCFNVARRTDSQPQSN